MSRNSPQPAIERETKFVERVKVFDSGCHEWVGFVTRDGYGRFWDKGSSRCAHRVSYEMFVEPIPGGLEIDHLCRNRLCVNPDHLEPVTRQENIARSDAGKPSREKSRCPNGHPYSGDNLYEYQGKRACKTCRNDAAFRYRKRRQEHQTRWRKPLVTTGP